MGSKESVVSDVFREIEASKSNQNQSDLSYESYLGIIDGERDEKAYDWQSDIRIPIFMAHFLTQSSIDVGQYFQTRDFVEVKINDPSDIAKKAAESAKECLNRTLNQREIYHYQKFVRGKAINNLSGRVWLKCWWDQEFKDKQTGTRKKIRALEVDINGYELQEDWQIPATEEIEEPVIEPVAVVDHFNYDVWDQRNVFTSDEYVYSAQQKSWIVFRSESTKSEIEAMAEKNGYFDIEEIENPLDTTETKQESYQKYDARTTPGSKAEKLYDLYERYGKAWFDGEEIGIDENGDIKEGATYEEAIITIVNCSNKKVLIGYKKTHFIDSNGIPYKPAIRGLCYIHPAEDNGIGDGQNVRELQTAIDDTFNISQDRVMLATLPSLKGKKNSIEDNTSIIIEPMGMMALDDVDDVKEFQISSDITGALNQLAYLEDKGRQVDSINETTTGGVPSIASTTATAVGAATQNTNTRMNYKSLTYEYTALTELYWMILQMTYAFATEKTAVKLMGEKVYDFNPSLDYYYTPLSQSIEPEASKMVKRREWTQIFTVAAQMQHPNAAKIVNLALGEFVKLMGDEYENAISKFLDESKPMQPGEQGALPEGLPTSNEYGNVQSTDEMMSREAAYA